ncbi:MAG: preprotein translocase subunit SecY [Coriobacteriales bacterium]|jgi:preprotein translocase subunit SecY|nr:preprotein translocase subunit SecY [Coriobacteriales bacterium]
MFSSLLNAFRIPELRHKIFFTLLIIAVYRFGAFIPVPGVDAHALTQAFSATGSTSTSLLMLNIFSGNALSNFSVLSLGIMPYITAQIIMQLMQGVIPAVARWAKEGEQGQKKITQITRYVTLGLGLINAIGYLFLFQSDQYGVTFSASIPYLFTCFVIIFTLVGGVALIMWMGELITQRGVGNGMSLIIFANVLAGFPYAIQNSIATQSFGFTALVVIVALLVVPGIVLIERAQRRIPVNYAKRVSGRRVMGGQSTYIPLKVNGAGVIAIIFASSILYFPAQIAVFFNVDWLTGFANNLTQGPLNWVLDFLLIVFFCFFYTSLIFNPQDTADNLQKQGGFIPGVRPGHNTVQYIKNVLNRITLPGGIYVGLIAVIPSMLFLVTNDRLIQTFGGTSILIMVGVALDTMSKIEAQLKTHHYEGFFEK